MAHHTTNSQVAGGITTRIRLAQSVMMMMAGSSSSYVNDPVMAGFSHQSSLWMISLRLIDSHCSSKILRILQSWPSSRDLSSRWGPGTGLGGGPGRQGFRKKLRSVVGDGGALMPYVGDGALLLPSSQSPPQSSPQ